MSVTQIWERLLIGGLNDVETLAKSNPLGVTTVVTLCPEGVRNKAEGINYPHIPLRESRPIPAGKLDEIIDALWENIRWGKVLIHSAAGSGRAPVLAAAWMHCCGYKNIDDALDEIGRLRPIDPSPALFERVKRGVE